MVRTTIPLLRVRGVAVGVHVSWLVVFGLVTWSVAMGFVPQVLPAVPALEAWAIGAVCAVLLFASVLAHELAHSLVAIARGLPVHSITLFLFGGVSELSGESKEPRTEFVVAIVGPLTSIALALVAFAASVFPLDARLAVVLTYLTVVNGLLGAFNLLPGFPLDGGRVLRAVVWKATGSIRRATEVAAAVGQVVGYGLIAWGVFGVVGGDLLGGLWTAGIGFFLQNAAGSSVRGLAIDQRLGAVHVRDAFAPQPEIVAPGLPVQDLIEHHVLGRKRRAVLVTEEGRLVGIVTIGDLQHVPAASRTATRVGDVMTGPEQLVSIAPGASLREAAEVLAMHEFDQLPVVEDGVPLGTITRADIIRELQVREALDLTARPPVERGELVPGTQPGVG